jgi:uncharacterized protein (TIGR02145 family)
MVPYTVKDNTRPIRFCVVSIALSVAFGSVSASQEQKASGPMYSSKRMADGKQWTIQNLNVKTVPSYCYQDAEINCLQYGRLYTWQAARQGCQSLGEGWRLPTNEEWRQLASHYGGLREESEDKGKAAYEALVIGGISGFNALRGGGRSASGTYARLEAHGFYWTASESDAANAWLYNFGKGGQSLNRHSDGEKQGALSVRCVRE